MENLSFGANLHHGSSREESRRHRLRCGDQPHGSTLPLFQKTRTRKLWRRGGRSGFKWPACPTTIEHISPEADLLRTARASVISRILWADLLRTARSHTRIPPIVTMDQHSAQERSSNYSHSYSVVSQERQQSLRKPSMAAHGKKRSSMKKDTLQISSLLNWVKY